MNSYRGVRTRHQPLTQVRQTGTRIIRNSSTQRNQSDTSRHHRIVMKPHHTSLSERLSMRQLVSLERRLSLFRLRAATRTDTASILRRPQRFAITKRLSRRHNRITFRDPRLFRIDLRVNYLVHLTRGSLLRLNLPNANGCRTHLRFARIGTMPRSRRRRRRRRTRRNFARRQPNHRIIRIRTVRAQPERPPRTYTPTYT